MDLLTIHYNTPEMTEALARSVAKYMPGSTLHVFDNSNKRPFPKTLPNVKVIDNTMGQIIDIEKWLDMFPEKQQKHAEVNLWASAKHCKSVDTCFDLLPGGFILLDSDTLIEKDLQELWDESVSYVGWEEHYAAPMDVERVCPFCCYLNVPLLRENGIRYCNDNYMWMLSDKEPNKFYDTGAWLYKAVKDAGLPKRVAKWWSYVLHYGSASWHPARMKKDKWKEWLHQHRRVLE